MPVFICGDPFIIYKVRAVMKIHVFLRISSNF